MYAARPCAALGPKFCSTKRPGLQPSAFIRRSTLRVDQSNKAARTSGKANSPGPLTHSHTHTRCPPLSFFTVKVALLERVLRLVVFIIPV